MSPAVTPGQTEPKKRNITDITHYCRDSGLGPGSPRHLRSSTQKELRMSRLSPAINNQQFFHGLPENLKGSPLNTGIRNGAANAG
jgi:hypothetical protein